MRVSQEWLAERVDLPTRMTGDELAQALLRIGFETEGVHIAPPTVGELVVGRVDRIEELTGFKKPIRFCLVDVGPGHGPDGSDGPREIICGALNFAEGDRVVVALPGTELPGGFQIASRQTYGHLSDGMICAVRELGIGTEHDGILVLDDDAPVGVDARSLIGADDAVVELAVTADRGYALSIRGLAREAAAALDVSFSDPYAEVDSAPDSEGEGWPVRLTDPADCRRFVTVRVTGVNPAAPSPFWLRRRLAAAGIRSISLAVDVTNYVMIDSGQPLHAFDSERLNGSITVRRAVSGETLRTLDGVTRTLDPDDLVVADESGPVSLAGVMGGESTEISVSTTEVVLEAAWWEPTVIYRSSRRHQLPSEASRRFERGVDPAIAMTAARAAAELLVRYGGGRVAGRSDAGGWLPAAVIELPVGECERLAGRPYPVEVIVRRLTQVGVQARPAGDVLLATPPSWRPDLTRPADLVEEVARLEGYDSIPSILPVAPAGTGLTPRQRRARAVADDLAAAGLVETLSFPFVGSADLDALGLPPGDVRRTGVRLRNPLDAERPRLATTLLPPLLTATARNLSRGARDLAVFEINQVFLPRADAPRSPVLPVDRRPTAAALAVADAALPAQPRHVAAVLAGAAERRGWWGPGRRAGWADAIELARRVGRVAGVQLRVGAAEMAPFHPGRCARIAVGDWPVGYAGELHPGVCERFGLPERTAAFELDLDALPWPEVVTARPVSEFPPVYVDLAVVVSAQVPAADVTTALVAGGGELLESARLFDVYTGPGVPADYRSLAFALLIRAPDRTLTATEANRVRDAALAGATAATGARLR